MVKMLSTLQSASQPAASCQPQQRHSAAVVGLPLLTLCRRRSRRSATLALASDQTHQNGDAAASVRRAVLAGAAFLFTSHPLGQLAKAEPLACESGSFTYTDAKQKFSLCVPSAFEQKEKMGATSLFEDPERRSTQVGVTVNPVRINSLEKFGSLQDVGDKLLGAERAKESTLECNLLYQDSRVSDNGVTFYEYGYELDSTRGRKRIQTSVTINDSKLYILNINVKCDKESCAAFEGTVADLSKTIKSFSVY